MTNKKRKLKVTSRLLNRELKITQGYNLKFWRCKHNKEWVIEGVDKNGEWFARGTCITSLKVLTFEQWINKAIRFYNGESI